MMTEMPVYLLVGESTPEARAVPSPVENAAVIAVSQLIFMVVLYGLFGCRVNWGSIGG